MQHTSAIPSKFYHDKIIDLKVKIKYNKTFPYTMNIEEEKIFFMMMLFEMGIIALSFLSSLPSPPQPPPPPLTPLSLPSVRFHNTENRPTHGIAVANHTSPIDSMVLATDQCYDMVSGRGGGWGRGWW